MTLKKSLIGILHMMETTKCSLGVEEIWTSFPTEISQILLTESTGLHIILPRLLSNVFATEKAVLSMTMLKMMGLASIVAALVRTIAP
jgi:hypothetical protein